jgi:hypothetical protein
MAYQTVVDSASIDLPEVARGAQMTEQQARLRILTGR